MNDDDETSQAAAIPTKVVHALEVVDHELREDVIDPETITLFVRLYGFDDACDWLVAHPALHFEALRQCRQEHDAPGAAQHEPLRRAG